MTIYRPPMVRVTPQRWPRRRQRIVCELCGWQYMTRQPADAILIAQFHRHTHTGTVRVLKDDE